MIRSLKVKRLCIWGEKKQMGFQKDMDGQHLKTIILVVAKIIRNVERATSLLRKMQGPCNPK